MIIKRISLLISLTALIAACDSDALKVLDGDSVGSDTGSVSTVINNEADNATDSGLVVNVASDNNTVADSGGSSEPVCVDTDPVGDGWGWDGTQSCRIGDVTDTSADSDDANPVNNNQVAANTVNEVTGDGSTINLIGLLKLEPADAETETTRALFGRLQNSLTSAEVINSYVPSSDTCEVALANANDSDEPQLTGFDQIPSLISSGETVVVSSNAGTFTTLSRVQGSAGPYYEAGDGLNVAQPSGLTLDVLGDEFPAFSGINISDVPPLRISNPPLGQSIDAFNFFTWNANNAPLSVVEIYTGGIGANNQEIVVSCIVVDDGNFTFPQFVRTRMGVNFIEDWSAYLRVVYTFSRNGDALMATANSERGIR